MGSGLDVDELHHLLTWVQSGVVSRSQLLALGAAPHDIKRMIRRKELTAVHPGVYVNHTGPLTLDQRIWAAVLVHAPCALSHESALPKPRRTPPIKVAIDQDRTVRRVPGVVAIRTADLTQRMIPRSTPPRIAPAHAVIDVALSKRREDEMFAVVADALQTRQITIGMMRAAMAERARLPRRTLLSAVLDDLESGANSVLERGWLDLERRHHLPPALRQVRSRANYRDAVYEEFDLVVELDGKAFHDTAAARDRDAGRDLEVAALDHAQTIRLTYGQVFRDGCRTVGLVAELLRRRGWTGQITSCLDCPQR